MTGMRRLWRVLLGAAAVALATLAHVAVTVPDVRPLRTVNPPTTAFMELRASQARAEGRMPRRDHRWVRADRISPHLARAVLVSEDAAFWSHDGLDLAELRESIATNLQRGRLARGGSTITQQLAKNLYLSPSKDPMRKVRELLIARRLEAELPKRRILELYLNVVEWGDGVYGAEAAARHHFGKSAAALTPSEAALLAGALVNPRVLDPSRPNARLLGRQRTILSRMGRASGSPAAPRDDAAGRAPAPDVAPASSAPAVP
jgi:monofunctional glycosyltransferase